jgi:hypothetical protein
VNAEFRRTSKDEVVAYFTLLSQHFAEREKNHETTKYIGLSDRKSNQEHKQYEPEFLTTQSERSAANILNKYRYKKPESGFNK